MMKLLLIAGGHTLGKTTVQQIQINMLVQHQPEHQSKSKVKVGKILSVPAKV
jgi:catalase (peroxidase I)